MNPHGINLTAPVYYTPEAPFLDHMLLRSEWKGASCQVPLVQENTQYDIIVSPNVTQVKVAGVNKTDGLPTGRKPVNGLVQVTCDAASSMSLTCIADGPFTVSMVPTKHRARFDAGERFNPDFLASIASFGGIRFMDWAKANTSCDARAPMTGASWMETGVPMEVQADLCNLLGQDMWTCVPLQFWLKSPSGVKDLLATVRKRLNPALILKVELSNEVWNTQFQQGKYALTQEGGPDDWYGFQSGKLAAILPKGAKIVVANQFTAPQRMTKTVTGFRRATSRAIDIIACAPYLTPPKDVVAAAAVKGDPAPVMGALEAKQVATYQPAIKRWADLAKAIGATCEAYECNVSFYPDRDDAVQEQQEALLGEAAHSEQAAALVAKQIADCRKAGFGMIHMFSDCGKGGESGYWGLRPSPQADPYPIGQMVLEQNDDAWRANRRGWLGARA